MRVGWLADQTAQPGGAELTQAEFRQAAPDGVDIIDCPAGGTWDECDRYVIHNCVTYTADEIETITDRPIVKYWHDVGPHVHPDVRDLLDQHATPVCCSPVQADRMGLRDVEMVPPPVDLQRFRDAAAKMNGGRSGAVSVGSWFNPGKAPHLVSEWASGEGFVMCPGGKIDFYGGGPYAPAGSMPVPYEQMADLLARYHTFVFLPTALEPFGRLVVEAWAAGCQIVTNRLVGARYWIEEEPDRLESASEDFWKVVLGA